MTQQSSHKRASIVRAVFVLILLMLQTTAAQDVMALPTDVNNKLDQALVSEAEAKGQISVLVGLAVDWDWPEVMSAAADQMLQQMVATTQAEVINELELDSVAVRHRYSHLPSLSVLVNATQLQQLADHPLVRYIEPNRLNQPFLGESTTLIGANNAWNAGFQGANTVVAILDTGVDSTHPNLAGRVVSEACYSTTDASKNATNVCPNGVDSTATGSARPCSIRRCDHGTHVAGIVASTQGVAPGANLIAIQVFTQIMNTELGAYDDDVIAGLNRVLQLRNSFNIVAVNLSLGGGKFTSSCDNNNQTYASAITRLRSARIAVVAATGNDSYTDGISLPACIQSAIKVGSTNDTATWLTEDQVSSFSNSVSFMDLLAPGAWIVSTVPSGRVAGKSGTSMATPHVAGSMAVLRSAEPTATVDDMLAVLKCTGIPIKDGKSGITKPRIQLDSAVTLLRNTSSGVVYLRPNDGNDADNGTFDRAVRTLTRSSALVPNNGIILTEPAVFDQPQTLNKPMIICSTAGGGVKRTTSPSTPPSETSGTSNQIPVAFTDEVTTISGQTIIINALENDSDGDTDTLTIISLQEPTNGVATINGVAITYTSKEDFAGLDEFAYSISDGKGGASTGSIRVTVKFPSRPPVATADSFHVNANESTQLEVLANDSDVNADILTITTVGSPTKATAVTDGQVITYTPNAGAAGADSFSYAISDGNGGTAQATVSLIVDSTNSVNHIPIARAASFATKPGQAVNITLSGSDSDDDPLTYIIAEEPTFGTLSGTLPNLVYTPEVNFIGSDSFAFKVNDGQADSSVEIVTISVDPNNNTTTKVFLPVVAK